MKRPPVQKILRAFFLGTGFLLLSGCGGGGVPSSSPPEAVCTGGTPPSTQTPASNQIAVYQSTCQGAVNTPVVTLTICVPKTSTCKDVPNILVDIGSTGLRLSHTLSIASELPQESENGPITECYGFVSGYNYGPVVKATVTLAQQTVTVPVQISDSQIPAPSSCVTAFNSSAPFEPTFNGILGLLFPQDDDGLYYENGIGPTTISTTLMVQNPVFLLEAPENNGVLLSNFPTVSPTQGAPTVSGLLTFGTGGVSGLSELETNVNAMITASYNGNSSLKAFFDSGSNGFFIDNPTIPTCSSSSSLTGFFCGTATGQSATLTGTNTNTSVTLHFSIESAETLFSTGNQDFSSLGGPMSGYFDAGFPAFLSAQSSGQTTGQTIGLEYISSTSENGYFLYGTGN
ncbi:hypothetical protein LFML04_0047 [Leptospirillum ferriphilum ML-04]|uniref:DUF3443 family protein n=1 Tax=Leptospirillum ferriphilum (strain ML-04) TaxID=1048260 RepID=J9Z886_LEPFM|nr:hypothetical protein LFML04_0047 [Leptospirillum ferriphilum ML-04]